MCNAWGPPCPFLLQTQTTHQGTPTQSTPAYRNLHILQLQLFSAQRTLRPSWPMPISASTVLLGHSVRRDPWDHPACTYFSFNSPARAPSMQRALGPPQPTPTPAQAIPPGHPSTEYPRTTSYNFSQPAKVTRHMQLHRE